jgi:hypothetical protein
LLRNRGSIDDATDDDDFVFFWHHLRLVKIWW